MQFLKTVIDDNRFQPEDVPPFEAKLFFEGEKRRVNLQRFTVLLFFATVIATFGIIGDSVATVIGAMIIAPLMRPIMATAAGLVMGDMKRAGLSLLLVVAGAVGVIALTWLLTKINVATVVSFETNGQITGRISPRMIDLYAALAAGAAGAFAMSRDDVADSLPGVAIAIALVPPLCVVGIGLSEGEWTSASSAMLLFLTNFLSILLAGGGVLALLGLSAANMKGLNKRARRTSFSLVVIGIVLVAIPLATTSGQVFENSLVRRETARSAEEWLAGTDYEISRVAMSGEQVVLTVHGSGERPPLSELVDRLGESIDQEVKMRLVVVPAEREDYVVVQTQ